MREAVFDPQRIFSLGLSLHQEGRLAEAQAMYGQVLDVLPEAVEPWTYLGMALIQQGEWHRALHPLDRSLALSPNQLDPLIYRGMALANLGRHPEAARDFEQAAGLAPDRADQCLLGGITGGQSQLVAAFDGTIEQWPRRIGLRQAH